MAAATEPEIGLTREARWINPHPASPNLRKGAFYRREAGGAGREGLMAGPLALSV